MIGDGGFVFALEKRGYLKAGPWTPEVTVEHPDAGELSFVLFSVIFRDISFRRYDMCILDLTVFYSIGLQKH